MAGAALRDSALAAGNSPTDQNAMELAGRPSMTAGAGETRFIPRARRLGGSERGRTICRLLGAAAVGAFVVACAARTHHSPDSTAGLKRALVGKWTLTSADGRPAAELGYGRIVLDIQANGKWVSQFPIIRGKHAGFTIDFDGKWRLRGDSVQLSDRMFDGTARVRVDGDQLTVDPDFIVRRNDERVTCTYQREAPPQTGARSEHDPIQ